MGSGHVKTLAPGTQLQAGRNFRIEKVLGDPGGFGITYLAYFEGLNKRVAIKEYFPQEWCDRNNEEVVAAPFYKQYFDEHKKKFLGEAKRLANFENKKHIVNITDVFEENGTAYFVMEYIKGFTLFELVKQKGVLLESEAIKYVQQVGQALEIVHNSNPPLLHRDVKPQNILIRENGEAVLIDFGAARPVVSTNVEHTGILTHGFAPPEQYDPLGKKGPFIDIYALGATFYFCVTGNVPLSAPNRVDVELPEPIEVNLGLSQETNDGIIKAMAMSPEARHRNISDFTYALSKIKPVDGKQEYTLTDQQDHALNLFNKFLEDEETPVLILSGPEGSGKTFLIWHLLSKLRSLDRTANILSIGSRISDGIKARSGLDISSLYSFIYDLTATQSKKDDVGKDDEQLAKRLFPLSPNHDSDNTVYIIDESHLLSDNHVDHDLFKLGSGKLLNDFIEYVNITNHPDRKIVLIGDSMQLLRGKKDESAIWHETLEMTYSLSSIRYDFTELAPGSNYEMLSQCVLPVQKSLVADKYNRLQVLVYDQQLVHLERHQADFYQHYRQCSANDTIILAHALKQCLRFNNDVRKYIYGRQTQIQSGDRVMLQNQISVQVEGKVYTINRGEIGTIVSAGEGVEDFVQPIRGRGRTKVVFRKAIIQFERMLRPVSIQILDHLLNSVERDISTFEYIALRNRAKKNVLDQFGSSISSDEKALHISRDEYQNAAHFKYAYSITCHKAQGQKWKNVFIQCESEDLGKASEEYFRWLYTALACSSSTIYLLSPPYIFPWQDITWHDNPTTYDEFYSFDNMDQPAIVVSRDIPVELEPELARLGFRPDQLFLKEFWVDCYQKLSPHSIQIEKVEHRQYHEIYHFRGPKNDRARFIFYYNSKQQFGKRKLLPKGEFTDSIVNILAGETNTSKGEVTCSFERDFLNEFHTLFTTKLKEQVISIARVREHTYSVEYVLQRGKEVVILNISYNGKGFITKAMPQKYNSINLHNEAKASITTMSIING